MKTAPTLVILAAGMGSRYGGLKQLETVGPAGETVMDYAVFDALRSGFGRVLFIIRREFEAEFRAVIGARYADRIPVAYAYQALDDLPSGRRAPGERTKPWGTGHAVWCARREIAGPFAVINADDFYGRDSFAQLGSFLTRTEPSSPRPQFAMVGFQLAQTLSENGAVSRGVCEVGNDGRLKSVTEHTGILPEQVGPGRTFAADTTVSMNCWGFTPALFPLLERRLSAFLEQHGTDAKAEFYLPSAISAMIVAGEVDVQVLRTGAAWFGVTYRDDKPRVVAALSQRVTEGEYPAPLFAVSVS